MVSTPRFIGVLAGGCLLCLALSNCQSILVSRVMRPQLRMK